MVIHILRLLTLVTVLVVSCNKQDPYNRPDKPNEEETIVEPQPSLPRPGEYVLPLIETTDIHGYIVYSDDSGVHYRLAYIADKADDLRVRGEDRLLLLDGGDLYQGASVSNLMGGWPVFASMDIMGYDAVALGNHEFDWEIDNTVDGDSTLPDYQWNGVACVNEVPVVCANLYKDGRRASFTRDYVVVEKSAENKYGETVPVKIGIIGFAVDYSGSIMASRFASQGFSINADFSIANSIAADLEDSGECDVTVLLIHGVASDAAAKLGQGSRIDLVLGGHSHQTMSGRSDYGVPFLQGGRYCEHYGYAELAFTVDDQGNLAFSRAANMMNRAVDPARDVQSSGNMNREDLSADIVNVSNYALSATADAQNAVIGRIDVGATSAYINGSGGRAATISNWMCDITRRIGGADVAFVNGGGIRTNFPLNGASSRNITVANVYEMFPFSNAIYVYRLTYAELLAVFEFAMTSGGEGLFSRMTGIDCYYTETSHGSYSTYSVHSLRKDGTVIYQGGKWTGDWASRSVTLAVGEYLATYERTDYYTGLPNPLVGWNQTDRLVGNSLVDNDNAVLVLRSEAAASGGLLRIDTAPHFILY